MEMEFGMVIIKPHILTICWNLSHFILAKTRCVKQVLVWIVGVGPTRVVGAHPGQGMGRSAGAAGDWVEVLEFGGYGWGSTPLSHILLLEDMISTHAPLHVILSFYTGWRGVRVGEAVRLAWHVSNSPPSDTTILEFGVLDLKLIDLVE